MKYITRLFAQRSEMDVSGIRPLILAVLGTALLSTAALAAMDVNRPFMLLLVAVFAASILLAMKGYTAFGSWIALISALVILSYLTFVNNGIRDIAVMGLIAVLVAAGLLAGRFGTVIIGSLIILEIGVYGALEAQRFVVNEFSHRNHFADYFALSLAVGLITALQWLVITRLNLSIHSAREALAEHEKTRLQLQEAETQYRDLIDSIPVVIYAAEPGLMGRWRFVSKRIIEMTGFTPEEWTNDPGLWQSQVHPDDLDQVLEVEKLALQAGKMPRLEYRLKKRDGAYIWIFDQSLVMLDADTLLVQGFMLDVTERKMTEEQLTRRLAELQAVHGISEALVRRSDLQKLIHETGEQIRLAFKANNVLLAIHDPGTNLIHFPYDYEDGETRKDVPIRYGEGMTTKIMEGKKPLFIDRDWLSQTTALNAIYTNKVPIKSSFSAPIMTDEQVMGVITLESTEREAAFSEIDTRPILTIAANLAVAIEKTRLQDSIRQEMDIQETLIRELEIKNEELERFTYTASHDLKSPLITIRGFLGYLEKDAQAGNFEKLKDDIRRIADATEKMHRLLGELLELSRVGRVTNEKTETPFGEIVAEALRRVEGQLIGKQIEMKVGSGFPTVRADKERIIEVIQNLLDNAVKFMGGQKKPFIEINFTMQDEHPIFYVRDNGRGIKKKFHKRVFGLFDKLDSETEGTGVGLALVKRIVEVHGGSVWVESEEGEGATFYFTLG